LDHIWGVHLESRRVEALVKAFQQEKELCDEDITSFKMIKEDSKAYSKDCKD
jgi:hypothetical protein